MLFPGSLKVFYLAKIYLGSLGDGETNKPLTVYLLSMPYQYHSLSGADVLLLVRGLSENSTQTETFISDGMCGCGVGGGRIYF